MIWKLSEEGGWDICNGLVDEDGDVYFAVAENLSDGLREDSAVSQLRFMICVTTKYALPRHRNFLTPCSLYSSRTTHYNLAAFCELCLDNIFTSCIYSHPMFPYGFICSP